MLCIDGGNDGDRDVVLPYGKIIHLSSSPSSASKSVPVTIFEPSSNNLEVNYHKAEQKNFFDGLLGCFKPVWTIIGKAAVSELKQQGISVNSTVCMC